MEKRKITAREILRDVRSGVSDQDLMEKYTLSAQGLQSVFHKLVSAGVITQAELDDRVPITERTVDIGLYICPACGNIQGKEFITCPRCGFTAPGRGRATQEDRPTIGERKTSAPPQRRQTAEGQTRAKLEAAPLPGPEDSTESEQIRDPFPDLTRTLAYTRLLGIAALVSYVLAAAGIIILRAVPSAADFYLVGLALLGIPAIAIAIIIFVALQALAESIKVFTSVAGSLSANQSRQQ